MNEGQRYIATLLAFKAVLEKYGPEQVQYDLQRFAEEFRVYIEKTPMPDRKTGNLF